MVSKPIQRVNRKRCYGKVRIRCKIQVKKLKLNVNIPIFTMIGITY
jgi:hypothetical protein